MTNSNDDAIPGPGRPIEITPAMVDAGVTTLQESGALSYENEAGDSALVKRIFEAMLNASE